MAASAISTYDEREQAILQAAADCIEASSLLDFTMSAISKAAGMSMGSIYKHIQTKEDVLLALGCASTQHFESLVREIMAMPLPIVARLVAVQLVDPERASPFSFGTELSSLLANDAILRRGSPGWLERFFAADRALEDLFRSQLRAAVFTGDLVVNCDEDVDDINTATWSLCVGYVQVARQRSVRISVTTQAAVTTESVAMRALQRLLNTYTWTAPLTDALIAETCAQLESRGLRAGSVHQGKEENNG